MANIHNERHGDKTYYLLQFYDKDNRRRSIRRLAVNKKSADAFRVNVEVFLSASISGSTPIDETARQRTTISDDSADKLRCARFGEFVAQGEQSLRLDAADKLAAYFGLGSTSSHQPKQGANDVN